MPRWEAGVPGSAGYGRYHGIMPGVVLVALRVQLVRMCVVLSVNRLSVADAFRTPEGP